MSDESKPAGATASASPTDRLCPLFSAASLARGGEGVACQGAACMWYCPVIDGQGRQLPGQCSAYQTAIGLSLINVGLRDAAKLDSPFRKKV